ncbi:NADAR family protein [Psychromonas sp. KJ10-10]|uniref:NADAR family protein n=1 Tax=Psychromonas sp. KJ10-10 TaxID=3391823 RepID=UPI0039B47C2F
MENYGALLSGKKFDVHEIQQEIRLTLSPVAAKEIALNNLDAQVKNWHDIKCDVMTEALKAKFSQHIELKELLIATGTKTIVEYSPNDTYWGDPGDGSGLNKLGHMLMKLRCDINSKCES